MRSLPAIAIGFPEAASTTQTASHTNPILVLTPVAACTGEVARLEKASVAREDRLVLSAVATGLTSRSRGSSTTDMKGPKNKKSS